MTSPCTHPAAEPDNNKEARGSNENASNNIGQGANQEDIADLRRQGVKIENEDCLPENLPTSKNENHSQPRRLAYVAQQYLLDWLIGQYYSMHSLSILLPPC